MGYFKSSNLDSFYQFGLSKHSTELDTAFFTNKVRIDKGELTGATYVDLIKAFHTTHHGSLTTYSHSWKKHPIFKKMKKVTPEYIKDISIALENLSNSGFSNDHWRA